MDYLELKRKLANDTQVLAVREIINRWGAIVVEFNSSKDRSKEYQDADYYVVERHRDE